MLRFLQRFFLPSVLATAAMLAIAGPANAHAGHGGSTRAAAAHSERHGASGDALHHGAAQHDTISHTATPLETAIGKPARASTAADASASPCGDHRIPATDAGCCAVTCHSAVGVPLAGTLAELAVVRIVPDTAVRTLHGSGTGGTERPPRLG
jgi:hypothetical protein